MQIIIIIKCNYYINTVLNANLIRHHDDDLKNNNKDEGEK